MTHLIENTNINIDDETEEKCIHHYILPETATKGVFVGICKRCGVKKEYFIQAANVAFTPLIERKINRYNKNKIKEEYNG